MALDANSTSTQLANELSTSSSLTSPSSTLSANASSPVDILGERIRLLLRQKQNKYSLRRFLSRTHFADLAEVMVDQLSLDEAQQCFLVLPPAQAAQVLPSLDQPYCLALLKAMSHARASRIIRHMPVDESVDLLQAMGHEDRRLLLGEMPLDADTRSLHQLLIEAPDTAAGIMSTDLIKAPIDQSVGQALQLVHQAEEKDFIYYCYLVDRDDKLVGVVSLKTLVIYPPETPLQEVASFEIKSVLDSFDQELVANLFRKYYNLLAMPVVDSSDRLLGVITMDDIIDVIDEESQEDLYRASGIVLEDVEEERTLLAGPVWYSFKARVPWLCVTLVGQLFVATIIATFTDTVSGTVKAFSFLPLLCGLAGNTGTQSDTITVRGIALEQIRPDNVWQQWRRELRVALAIGGFFAMILGGVSFIQYHHGLLSALLMAYIILSVSTSCTLGIWIPYVMKYRFNKDPAGIGGPFVTTLVDLTIYATYLSVLTMLDRWLI
jgi:magnesium transporter